MPSRSCRRDGMSSKDLVISTTYGICLLAQLILSFIYYDHLGLDLLTILGWVLLISFGVVGGLTPYEFRKRGAVPPGKSWVETTMVVDTGIYSVVRHPQWLTWMMFSLGLMLISQHWAVLILGLVAIPLIYLQTFDLDIGLVEKFGDEYADYMRRVPRVNMLLGIVRRLRAG